MKYKVKIKYWNGWAECYVWLTRIVAAYDCVEALRLVLEESDLDDDDIEEIDITMEA